MDHLENRLRKALRSEEPSPGFTERVLARTQEATHNAWSGIFAWRSFRWGLVGALCLALWVAGIGYRQERVERIRRVEAKEQLMLALRIAADQLQFVRSRINNP